MRTTVLVILSLSISLSIDLSCRVRGGWGGGKVVVKENTEGRAESMPYCALTIEVSKIRA